MNNLIGNTIIIFRRIKRYTKIKMFIYFLTLFVRSVMDIQLSNHFYFAFYQGKKLPKTTITTDKNNSGDYQENNSAVIVTTSEKTTNVKQPVDCEENISILLGKSILPDILIAPTTPRQLTNKGT